jgi:LPPG:FO 2-phospho-L-lactate transferase
MKLVLLSGGVGGARLARGLTALSDHEVTVVVNTGDDDMSYGLEVSPDLDTVVYTIAGVEGPQGWGRSNDSFTVMGHLAELGIDTSFQVGDADLAINLYRTQLLRQGIGLTEVTRRLTDRLGLTTRVLPMTDAKVRTMVQTVDGHWRSFKEYFVERQHKDQVADLRFDGALEAQPAPGVLEALAEADAVIIGPSNPVLSVWPILAVPGIAGAVSRAPRVLAVSPLFGGEALKGPAHAVMADMGLPFGNAGIAAAYDGLVNELVIDAGDAADRSNLTSGGLTVHVRSTLLTSVDQSQEFAEWLAGLLMNSQ